MMMMMMMMTLLMQECFKTVCHEVPAICNKKSKETIALCKISKSNNNNLIIIIINEIKKYIFLYKIEESSEEVKT